MRRLVHLTGLSWQWDCLAKFEQDLPGHDFLCPCSDLLGGSYVDLEFSSLEHLLGFNIGFIEGEMGPGTSDVGLAARGTTFRLSTEDGAVYYPVRLEGSVPDLEEKDRNIDALCLPVGGKHDFNLAYVPKHIDFERAKGKEFKDANLVREAFVSLAYGEQMSDAMFNKAWDMLHEKKRRVEPVTLLDVQRRLLSDWKRSSDRQMIPLSFQKKINPRRDTFMVLNNGELLLAKSNRNVSKSATFGLNVHFGRVSIGATITDKEILTQGPVSNVFDAISHLLGYEPKFEKEGINWYKPTRDGMRDITCALTFLPRAVVLYDRAIDKGHVKAMVNLACLLNDGDAYVDADPVRAVELWNRAVEKGDADAMFNLAKVLKNGAEGVDADPARALELYDRAIAKGHVRSMSKRASFLENFAHRAPAIPLWNRAIAKVHVRATNKVTSYLETLADFVDPNPGQGVVSKILDKVQKGAFVVYDHPGDKNSYYASDKGPFHALNNLGHLAIEISKAQRCKHQT